MKKIIFLTLALIAIFAACSKPEPETGGNGNGSQTGPEKEEEVVEATISLSPEATTLGGSMFDTAEISVSTNQTKITPVSDVTWMTAKMMGKILIITAAENNETGAARTGTVTVTAGEGENTATATLTVTQALRDATTETPRIELTSQPADMDAAAGATTYVTFTTNQSEVSVSFAGAQDWLSFQVSEGKVTFTTLNANTLGTIRTIDVTITAGSASVSCTIRQFSDAPKGIVIGALYEGGMIFEIAADYIKVISITEGSCFWASDELKATYIGTVDNPENGGKDNTDLIRSHSNFTGNFPAAEWCVALGEGWYLPSRKEYTTFIDNLKLTSLAGQEATNAFLAAYGGAPLTIGTQYYWTCCEKNETNAWCVRLNDKAHGNYNKKGSSERPVRAVKKIEMDMAGSMDKVDGGLGDFNITEENWTNN